MKRDFEREIKRLEEVLDVGISKVRSKRGKVRSMFLKTNFSIRNKIDKLKEKLKNMKGEKLI